MFQENAGQPPSGEAAMTFLRESIAQLTPLLFNAVGALLVLIIGMWIAGRVKTVVRTSILRSGRVDVTLGEFLSSLAYYGLVALVIITTLGIFGVPTTSFAAIIGAAGLAIGLALQGTLGHVASGVMMLGFRPFNVGDVVETGGIAGKVTAITLFTTELATVDNKKVIIPNGKVWDNPITNYTAYPTRRVDLAFGVSYGADLNKAIAAMRAVVKAEPLALDEPPADIEVDELKDSSVSIICRVWVNTADYFTVKWRVTKAVKERLDADGIGIPFPTRTLIMEKRGDD